MVGFFFSGNALCCDPVASIPRQLPGTHMNTESTAMARPSPQQEADAALQSLTDRAKAENLSSVAELSEGTDKPPESPPPGDGGGQEQPVRAFGRGACRGRDDGVEQVFQSCLRALTALK
jgi:hypothetical protein